MENIIGFLGLDEYTLVFPSHQQVAGGKVNAGPRQKPEGEQLVQGTPKPGQVVPKIMISDIKEMQSLFLNDILGKL